jgi:hypothetical protein
MDPPEPQWHAMVGAAIVLVVPFGPLVATVAAALLSPGRKGYLKTELQKHFDHQTLDEVRRFIRKRLEIHDFHIPKGDAPETIRAERRSLAVALLGGARSPRQHALKLRIALSPTERGVQADLWMRSEEFVIKDTGESRYFRGLAETLLGSAPSQPAEPPEPEEPFGLAVVRWQVRFVWAAIAVQVVPGIALEFRGAGLLGGLFGCVVGSFLALYTLAQMAHDATGGPDERAALRRSFGPLWLGLLVAVIAFAVLHGKAAFETPPTNTPATTAPAAATE